MVERFVLKAKDVNYDLYIGQNGVLVNTEDNALKFVTVNKAVAYQTNCLTQKARVYKWETISCGYDKSTNNTTNDTTFYYSLSLLRDRLEQCTVEKGLSDATIRYLDSILKLLSTKEKAIKLLSESDMALSDIQHYIELHTLNKEDCIKVIQLQQKLLKRRRVCKDRLATISNIENLGLDYWKKIVNQLCGLSDRKYTNRVIGK